jgi:hypothetical protein
VPGDALWAFAACLLIEAIFAPVARIICTLRYHILLQRNAESEPAGTDAAKQKAGS